MREALIVWGGWDGHDPEECASIVAALLANEGFGVRVESSTAAFADPKIRDLSLIVPIVTMSTIAKEEAANLVTAVESGVGLAGHHGGAADSFRDCVEYQFMIGGQWVAHPGNIIDYEVNITRPDDPHEVVAVADPVDHCEQSRRFERREYPVPGAAVEIDRLPGRGEEGQRIARRPARIRRDDRQKGTQAHRHEGLAAERVPFDQVEAVGQGARHGVEQAERGAPARIRPAEIELSPVMVPLAEPRVDEKVRPTGGVEHVAERRKGLCRKRDRRDFPAHSSASSRCSAIRSTWAQAAANSVSLSWAIRCSKARRIPVLSWSRTAMMKGNPCFAR